MDRGKTTHESQNIFSLNFLLKKQYYPISAINIIMMLN